MEFFNQPTESAPSSDNVSPAATTTHPTMATAVMTSSIPPALSPLTTHNLQQHISSSSPQSASPSPSPLSSRRPRSPNLSLDLSTIPQLSSPAPPSNTLLITRLEDPKIFHPASLATIRQHLNSIAPLHSFSPLKSLARIIVSFYDEESAVKVRQEIDRTAFSPTSIAKCYFGEPTPINDEKKYLDKPDAGRLFFISPPPSPPVGWEMKMEDPPNKEVHAEDLASQLAKLAARIDANDETLATEEKPQFTAEELSQLKSTSASTTANKNKRAFSMVSEQLDGGSPTKLRSRSSTIIYDPKIHGDSPGLPAVMLETEDDSEVELDDETGTRPMAHTARPPVELMEH